MSARIGNINSFAHNLAAGRGEWHSGLVRLRSRQQGFTLIEMLVVISIIAILMVVSVDFFTALYSSIIRSQQSFAAQATQENEFGYLNARLASATQLGLTCATTGNTSSADTSCSSSNNLDALTLSGDQFVFTTATACYRVMYVASEESIVVAAGASSTTASPTAASLCSGLIPTRGPNQTGSTVFDPVFGNNSAAALFNSSGGLTNNYCVTSMGAKATGMNACTIFILASPIQTTDTNGPGAISFTGSANGANTAPGTTGNYPFSFKDLATTSIAIDAEAANSGSHANWYSSATPTTCSTTPTTTSYSCDPVASLFLTSYTRGSTVTTAPISVLQQNISATQTGTGGANSAGVGAAGTTTTSGTTTTTATTTPNADVACTASVCKNVSIHPTGDTQPPATGCTGLCAGLDNGTSLPSCTTNNDGKIIYYQNAAMATQGITWQFRCEYYTATGGANNVGYLWEFVGGAALSVELDSTEVVATTGGTWTAIPNMNVLSVPLSGNYQVSFGGHFGLGSAASGSAESGFLSPYLGTTPSNSNDSFLYTNAAVNLDAETQRVLPSRTLTSGTGVGLYYQLNAGASRAISSTWLEIIPVSAS